MINEGCNKNATAVQDENGDAPDWIELYNNSASVINLENWKLSDQLKNWLVEVNAIYPEKDDQFDVENRKIYDEEIVNKLLPKLETERIKMLSVDFEPNTDWWGSKVTKD